MRNMNLSNTLSKSEMHKLQGGGIFDLYWVPVFGPIWKESDRLDKELEKTRTKNKVDIVGRIWNQKSIGPADSTYQRNK